jgi:hypothetical protein
MTRIPMLLAASAVAALAAALSLSGDASPTGEWKLRVAWPDRPAEVTLEVRGEGPGLEARWIGPRGTLEAQEVRFDEPELTFTLQVSVSTDGGASQPTTLAFRGAIEGDRLHGDLRLPDRDPIAVEGVRGAEVEERPQPEGDPH